MRDVGAGAAAQERGVMLDAVYAWQFRAQDASMRGVYRGERQLRRRHVRAMPFAKRVGAVCHEAALLRCCRRCRATCAASMPKYEQINRTTRPAKQHAVQRARCAVMRLSPAQAHRFLFVCRAMARSTMQHEPRGDMQLRRGGVVRSARLAPVPDIFPPAACPFMLPSAHSQCRPFAACRRCDAPRRPQP